MPDANSTAQILQNIAQMQQERIRQMNQQKIQYAGLPGSAAANFYQSFMGGRKAAEESQHAQDVHDLAETQKETQQAQLGSLKLQQQRLQSEEDAANEVDPNDPQGRTYREESPGLAADTQRQSLALNAQGAQDMHASTMANIENARQSLSMQLRAGLDAHQNDLLTQYEHQVDNIAMGTAPGPERDAKIAAVGQQYGKMGLPQSVIQGGIYRSSLADFQKGANKAAQDVAFWSASPEGAALKSAIGSAQGDAQYYQQLVDAMTKYQAALKLPGFDEGGSLNEKSPASDARKEFASVLASHGHTTEAQALLDTQVPWNTALDQMHTSIQTGLPGAIHQWNSVGKTSAPAQFTQPNSPQYKAEVGTVDNMFANVLKSFQGASNSRSPVTPGVDSVNPLTGQIVNPKSLNDAIAARKARSGSQGAVGAPAPQQPVAQPAPAPQAAPPAGAPAAPAPAPQQPQQPPFQLQPTGSYGVGDQ